MMRGRSWQREHTSDSSAAAADMAGVLWPGGRTWLRKNVVGEASCCRGLLTGLPASILPPPSVGHTAERPFSTTAVTPRGSGCALNQDLLRSPSRAVRAFLVLACSGPTQAPSPPATAEPPPRMQPWRYCLCTLAQAVPSTWAALHLPPCVPRPKQTSCPLLL